MNINQYKKIADSYLSFEDCYKLLIETNNVEVCKYCLDEDGIWKRSELKWMLDYFINTEDYEKCDVLLKFIRTDYIANEAKQNELNHEMNEY
jgi:hypothetical protein